MSNESLEIVCGGRLTAGIRSLISLSCFARKKLKIIVKKSRGIFMIENVISCLFTER